MTTFTLIARHNDNEVSKWASNLVNYKDAIREVREAIVAETGKEPFVVLVRIK
jgi:hypothetical protein